ncbi:MAG TPA: hypothetical protein VH143_02025 [Kofleriaceae bacterium]|nr:hypothetical protein [Kofleriaceae bacterium]
MTISAKHLVPLLAISLVVFAVVVVGGAPGGLIRVVPDPAKIGAGDVRVQLRVDWIVAGVAWMVQLVLAGGAAALAREQPGRLPRAFVVGVAGTVRALVPCAIAIAAIVLGGAALVVPGIVLAVLLAFAGAAGGATPGALPSEVLDASVAAARAHWRDAAVAVAAIVAADVAIAAIAQLVLVHAGAPKLQLAQARDTTRVVVLAYAFASPFAASLLAAVYDKAPK